MKRNGRMFAGWLCGLCLCAVTAQAAVSGNCETNADCDDQQPCTIDTCVVGQCVNTMIDCDDDNACTDDSCNEGGQCVNTPVSCNDQNKCTTDICDPQAGCTHEPINCNDDNPCTTDSCNEDNGQCLNEEIDCDDKNACTADSCDGATGSCAHQPVDCNDDSGCTNDSCDPMSGCVHTPACDDGDDCTLDSCDAAGRNCVNDPICGACCLPNDECVDGITESACIDMGGEYQFNGSDCSSSPCQNCVLQCAVEPVDCPPDLEGDDDDDDDDSGQVSGFGDDLKPDRGMITWRSISSVDGDDDDDDDGCPGCAGDGDDDDDDDGGLRWEVQFESNCPSEALIDIGCDVIPVDNGQLVQVDCGGDEPEVVDLCDDGRPCGLTLIYTGEDCSAGNNDQENDMCEGDPAMATPAYIIANDSENPGAGDVYFAGDVVLNGSFDISAMNAGGTKLSSNTWYHIHDQMGGQILQSIRFHTSCSKPLALGDQFGSLVVVGWESQDSCEGNLDGDDDDDAGSDCSFSICEDILFINSEMAVLTVTSSDGGEVLECVTDLCDPSGEGGGGGAQTADLNGDCDVDALDLEILAQAWGPNPGHPADFNGDGTVNGGDMSILLQFWGPCP